MSVKCVVWDLDNTLWDGILLEDDRVTLRSEVVDVIKVLDERGILHSVASRNDPEVALAKLRELGVEEYFLHPQIGWGSKSQAVARVAEALNIGVDTLAFVDDQPFERDEVAFTQPKVLCIDALDVVQMPAMEALTPRFITDSSRERRALYRADIERKHAEDDHDGTSEQFLASLDMSLTISPAGGDDLARAEELTVRTNQLNATGYTYSYEELDAFRSSADHDLLIAGLTDKYGTYGKIGLALVERGADAWTLKLLLMSCRVMARGVGSVLLNHIISQAHAAGVALRAEFVPTERNRTMYVTYKFAGFREVAKNDGVSLLENDLSRVQGFPPHMRVVVEN